MLLKQEKNLCGLNVTIPYKKEIIPYLDELAEESIAIGAVNTIKWSANGKSIGHNTDYIGFPDELDRAFRGVLFREMQKEHEDALLSAYK